MRSLGFLTRPRLGTIWSEHYAWGHMSDSGSPVDKVQLGDNVAYRLSTGDPVNGILGKVIAVFKTQDGKTLADVEWAELGLPGRLNITSLTKV
jgi:hypothetical protein